MTRNIVLTIAALLLAAAGAATAGLAGGNDTYTTTQTTGGGHTPVTICHKHGTPAEQTLVVDDDSVELTGHLGHGDTIGPCPEPTTSTETTPTTSTPTTTSPIPPTGQRCPPGMVPTAGKDGQPGNQECEFPKQPAAAPKPPDVVTSVTCPPAETKTVVHTTVKTVKSKPKVITRTITKTRVVYRTKVITKIKKVYVPGMHKNGVEGSG